MDQNNFNMQGNENNNQTPQQQNGYYQPPTYNGGVQQPYYGNQQQYYGNQQQGAYYQNFQQPGFGGQCYDPRIPELADSAFSKALASTIMCAFPITSIISIFLGAKALKLTRKIDKLAAEYGKTVGGKKTAAKILANIGKGFGIGMTIFWGLYIFIIVMAVMASL